MVADKQLVIGVLYNKISGNLDNWKKVECQPDQAESWREGGAWRGEHNERHAWIYVPVAIPPDRHWKDMWGRIERDADIKFRELYPGATIHEGCSPR